MVAPQHTPVVWVRSPALRFLAQFVNYIRHSERAHWTIGKATYDERSTRMTLSGHAARAACCAQRSIKNRVDKENQYEITPCRIGHGPAWSPMMRRTLTPLESF
jgi:hypothetical protein